MIKASPFFNMGPVQFLNKIRKIDVDEASRTAIENTTTRLIDVQQKQLFQGLKSDDTEIVPPYAPFTVREKTRKGQPIDRVTLRDTGSFYSGIGVDVGMDKFTIESADSKSQSLQQRYGTQVFGLGTAAKENYIRILKPQLIKVLKQQMQ